jgi:hypothetical protein
VTTVRQVHRAPTVRQGHRALPAPQASKDRQASQAPLAVTSIAQTTARTPHLALSNY